MSIAPRQKRYHSTDYLDLLSEFFHHIENLFAQGKVDTPEKFKKGFRKILQNPNLNKEARNQKVLNGLNKIEDFLRKTTGKNLSIPLEDFFKRVKEREEKLYSSLLDKSKARVKGLEVKSYSSTAIESESNPPLTLCFNAFRDAYKPEMIEKEIKAKTEESLQEPTYRV